MGEVSVCNITSGVTTLWYQVNMGHGSSRPELNLVWCLMFQNAAEPQKPVHSLPCPSWSLLTCILSSSILHSWFPYNQDQRQLTAPWHKDFHICLWRRIEHINTICQQKRKLMCPLIPAAPASPSLCWIFLHWGSHHLSVHPPRWCSSAGCECASAMLSVQVLLSTPGCLVLVASNCVTYDFDLHHWGMNRQSWNTEMLH